MRLRMPVIAAMAVVWVCCFRTAMAASPRDFAGTWVMRLGERNLFVLTLAYERDQLHGTFERPLKLSMTDGVFYNLSNSVGAREVVKSSFEKERFRFVARNAVDAADDMSFVMTLMGDHAELVFGDLPPDNGMVPFVFQRMPPGTRVATNWEPNRAYVEGDSDVPCAEMKAIFDEDQRVRLAADIDWRVEVKNDAARRIQTTKLLDDRALHTGRDFEEAAYVFQHGDSPNDYLMGHTLAMVAVSKGDAAAVSIAAATLDRYLDSIGQKQIFGTQFFHRTKAGWTQEPYDRGLVSDALRQQLGAAPLANQAEQLKAYQKQK